MAYTARIPEHVIFNGTTNQKEVSTKAYWQRLPSTNQHQKDARQYMEKGYEWYHWIPSSQKEVESRIQDGKSYVHENKPVKLAVVGWGTENMQAALPSGHLIDLPLDILYNAIRSGGFEKDYKTLKGEFIFAMANRKLIPIQVGSGLHKGILEHIKLRNKPKIEVRDLVVGNVYSTPAGNTALFLGYVNTETMVIDLPKGLNRWSSSSGTPLTDKDPVQGFKVRFIQKKLGTLWHETRLGNWQGKKYTSEDILKDVKAKLASSSLYSFRCKKSHRYVSKVPDLYVDLPTDIVMQVRNAYVKKAKAAVWENRLRRSHGVDYFVPLASLNGPPDRLRHFDAIRIQNLAAACNMTLYGLGIIRSDVFKDFEPWEAKKVVKKAIKKKKKS